MRTDQVLKPLFSWRGAVASKDGPESPVARHVLLTLSLHMNDKGESCFPSIKLLCEETALSNRAVITHLQQAEVAGWIKRKERRVDGQGWKRMEYHPTIPASIKAAIRAQQLAELEAEEAVDNPVDNEKKGGERHSSPPADAVNVTTEAMNVTTEGGERPSHEYLSSTSKRARAPETGAAPEKSTRRKAGTPIPEGFAVSPAVRDWALRKQIMPSYVELCLEAMVLHANTDDVRHVDWDKALMKWVLKEQKLHPREPWRAPLEDRQCRWTNQRTEPRCPAHGTEHIDGENYLCAAHKKAYDARARLERDRAALQAAA